MKTFYNLLGNNLIAGVTNFTVWFAIIFYIYLETRSVFATSMMSGIFTVATALTGIWFGSLVDHNKKKTVMMQSSIISLIFYAISFVIFLTAPEGSFKNINNGTIWAFIILLLLGVIAGNIRNIAIPTTVTLLVPEDRRDKANGLVGTVNGIAFMITSFISGLLVGYSGMNGVMVLSIVLTLGAIIHLAFLNVQEDKIVHLVESEDGTMVEGKKSMDIKGTIAVISAIPGLIALIFFTTFNNFIGGVFMSLMDAYGLSLVSVQVWGAIFGFLSTSFIIGGLVIAKYGLGKNPVRSLFLANIIIWTVCSFFTVYPSIILLIVGMFIFMSVHPFIEASEQTIIQKVVPQERQGRVFGFAQSVEQAASPLTAFLIGPITQFLIFPFMAEGGKGAELIGSWFGTGDARAMALVFTVTGIIGLVVTLISMRTKYYTMLSERYMAG